MRKLFAKLRHPVFAHLIFWLWNGLFISTAAFGLIPMLLIPMSRDAGKGLLPWTMFATVLVMVAIPFVATAIGFIALRKRASALLAFFFGVEAPAFLLALCRVFLIRELTPGVTFMLSIFALGCAALALSIFSPITSAEKAARRTLDLILGTVSLTAGLYAAIVISFYAIPAAIHTLSWLVDPRSWYDLFANPFRSFFGVLIALLVCVSFAFFAAMPLALIFLYARRFIHAAGAFAANYGTKRTVAIATAVFAAIVAGFIASNRQPQVQTFAMLEEKPTTDAERRALLEAAEEIREGLLNAYLAEHRYIDRVEGAIHIRHIWREALGGERDDYASVQDAYEMFAAPWLYQGGHDRQKAADLYEKIFDVSIQKQEKAAIVRAIETTWDQDEREAGLLNEGDRKVHVARQELAVVEHGDHAEVELHELYQNDTHEQQEIFYTFSLPASAVLTGLYLGDTDERSRRFPFVVAPRGAAQSVYKAEVQRRVDPALLEQIGPRQYRLRAFPIPPNGVLHMWLSYNVLINDGAIPLPHLAEQRNVYLDERTERIARAMPLELEDASAWFPPTLSAQTSTPPRSHTVQLAPHLVLRADPFDISRLLPERGQKFAIVLDRSRSMEKHREAVATAFDWLKTSILPIADVDLYLTSATVRGESPVLLDDPSHFDPSRTIYFGGQNPRETIEQMIALRRDRRYAAILVLTDDGSYDLAKDATGPLNTGAPLWMVHLGDGLPPGYDDGTLEAIEKSGGGISSDLRRAFAAIAFSQAGNGSLEDGYMWSLVTTEETYNAEKDGQHFAPIAARQWIRMQTRDLPEHSSDRIAALDRIHGLAKRNGIVTPYSSMLVLVDDAQRERLARAEQQQDRFDREVESGEERFSSPFGGFSSVTATPEPHEWAMLAIGVFGLIYFRAATKRRLSGGGSGRTF